MTVFSVLRRPNPGSPPCHGEGSLCLALNSLVSFYLTSVAPWQIFILFGASGLLPGISAPFFNPLPTCVGYLTFADISGSMVGERIDGGQFGNSSPKPVTSEVDASWGLFSLL